MAPNKWIFNCYTYLSSSAKIMATIMVGAWGGGGGGGGEGGVILIFNILILNINITPPIYTVTPVYLNQYRQIIQNH